MIPTCACIGDTLGCRDCMEEFEERAAILQYGQGTGWHDEKDPRCEKEKPTCRTREESEALARKIVTGRRKDGMQRKFFSR